MTGSRFLTKIVLYLCMCPMIFSGIVSAGEVSDVAEKYCRLDFEGVRFSHLTYDRIKAVMSQTVYTEPGWDSFLVVSGYKIRNEEIKGDEAAVTVEYSILASVDGAETVRKKTYTENVTVRLIRENGLWKINQYVPYPRMSVSSAISNLEYLLVIENNERGEKIRAIIRQLKELETGAELHKK